MNVFASIPVLESARFLLRAVNTDDLNDLTLVYGDRSALPFFNSDNRDGDNFYYATPGRMTKAMTFWRMAYEKQRLRE